MSRDRRAGDLDGVKVGDKLVAQGRYGLMVGTVQRITPTGFMVLMDGTRVTPRGYSGDEWSAKRWRVPTEDDLQRADAQSRARACSNRLRTLGMDAGLWAGAARPEGVEAVEAAVALLGEAMAAALKSTAGIKGAR